MIKIKYVAIGVLCFSFCLGACVDSKLSAVEKRQKALTKKHNKNPNDCPKLDCD